MNKSLAASILLFSALFLSACIDHVIKVKQIEKASRTASQPEFNPGDWKIEMSAKEPVVTMVDGVQHIDLAGANLIMIRKEK